MRHDHAQCAKHVEEYDLKEMYKSPNGTIRAVLGRHGFSARPSLVKGITPYSQHMAKAHNHRDGTHTATSTEDTEAKGPAGDAKA